jgi:hypothetical protein
MMNNFPDINMNKQPDKNLVNKKRETTAWPAKLKPILPDFSLKSKKETAYREENFERLKLIKNSVHVISKLPLNYLYSKPELKQYAFERVGKILVKIAMNSFVILLREAFTKWKNSPIPKLDDRQIQFLVIAKCFSNLLEKQLRIKFKRWAFVCADRYKEARSKYMDDAARDIQAWWNHVKITHRKPWRTLSNAIQMCLEKRRAIKLLIKVEEMRKNGIRKLKKSIVHKRRLHFASRAIQRILRWNMLRVWTTFRLTRIAKARRIQRWRRMILYRNKNDLFLIKQVLRFGGHTKVFSKMPARHLARGKLQSMNSCVSLLQKAYFTSRGRMDLYMRFAARRANMAHQEMLNEKANILQNSWRAHLWDLLMKAATMNNRARRIQRGYRAYQYRYWMWISFQRYKCRMAVRLQKNFRFTIYLYYLHNYLYSIFILNS